uniref:E3 ubiquitin-protein ligase n=1 Tax=Octopus bimaculoides TaxID=37653 RepID=A0A0L8GI50_OCTBM
MWLESAKEERLSHKLIFHPLETFLCGGDPETEFKQLKEKDAPSQICGHVFKHGEPSYSCRDCANDLTCVLCINCFQQSVHKKHRYRDRLASLPDELIARASDLFISVLQYSIDMMTWETYDSLPFDLRPDGEPDDLFVTILFNDELHTFDQGRSGIKTGGFIVCDKARKHIEQMSSRGSSKPLKVQVMHTTVVSHQKFALKAIQWLQYIISKSDGLRYLFCKLAMQPSESGSLMERLILADTKLWKIARIQSHQLLMSGVLRDQECKRQFGVMFTEKYSQLMEDFLQDDHDHEVSVVSLSVQIFTLTSLARFLITEHNLLGVILQTFLKQCESKKNKRGKLSFGRSENGNSFKRAWFILYDLKYALLCKPSAEEWTDQLKKSFCNGFNALLDLLISIQGMDSVTRKTGQHLEIEPEWESAFNLQLRLQDNIALFLDWCGSNASVFSDCFRSTLCTLYQCRDKLDAHKMEDCEVAGIVAQCIKYDVASQPVSIHLPVIRLFAGLYLHMDKFGICSPEMISQIFFYNNVRCRVEMYDKDIVMLQLLFYPRSNYDDPGGQEDSVRQTSVLAEEFLNLLIIILGERYTVGVGQVTHKDVVKREIIHQLCITPMAHSELVKALPEDWNHETGIELVVNEVANFKKSQVGGKGHYELKPEYCEQYNPYFYHYSRSEQSKSEESQMKKKKQAGEDRALPPPAPPRFCKLFAGVRNVLSCDVMIHIMTIVLSRTAAERSRSWSETQFERVLHLIGLALHEQKAAYENNEPFEFLAKATKGIPNLFLFFCDVMRNLCVCSFIFIPDGQNILKLLHSVVGSENLTQEYQSKLLKWVLNKFAAVRKMENEFESISSINNLSSTYDVKREQEKKKKAELAAKRRQRIMSQLSAMQRSFIQDNPSLCEMATSGLTSAWSDMDLSELTSTPFPVALGCGQTSTNNVVPIKAVCILCQEDQEISYNARVMVLSALVQRSSVLSQSRGKHINNEDEDPLFMSSDLFCGTHTSSCGHVMHADCWQRYFDAIAAKERRRPFRYRNTCSYNIEKLEFLCPLCGAISNTVIPMLPPLSTLRTVATGCDIDQQKAVDLSFNDWLDGIQKTVQASVKAAVDKESEALIPDGLEKKHEPPCILDLDMFHYLTVLVMSLPTLYAEGQTSLLTTFPTGSLNDQHALQLVLTAHLVQILLVYEPESQVCPWTLSTHLKQACLPFLRCAALMYHCITGVSTPPELQENSSNQFEFVCRFLALPSKLTTLFENQGDIISELMARWCSHPSIKDHFTASNQKIIRYPLPLNHLVKLPNDYSELMNQVSSYTCPRSSGDESRVPTMCLVCGQVLCSHSYCCQVEVDKKLVGAATAHSHVCGAGIGIFLRIRDCQIFLLAGQNKGCFQTAPYLDDYGETDQLLKRGNPLCLSEEHYKQLHRLWFQHEIPETIVHNLESNNSQVSYEWWNL